MIGADDRGSPLPDAWPSWLDRSLVDLEGANRLRLLRPVLATGSSTQALIHHADLDAWVHGSAPVVQTYTGSLQQPSATLAQTPSHGLQQGAAGHTDLLPLTLFSLNDYLGLASHPEVTAAAAAAAKQVGMGPRSSALVGGTTAMHRELEKGLAQLKGTEDCLLFPTGFAANMAVITSLCAGGGVDIFSDELNHASIVDGARLAVRGGSPATGGTGSSTSGTRLYVYRHNDLAHLEQLLLSSQGAEPSDGSAAPGLDPSSDLSSSLRRTGSRGPQSGVRGAVTPGPSSSGMGEGGGAGRWAHRRRQLVVTDSLFSMDGDFADLQGLAALRRRYGFLLVVDEAHSTLVCGDSGAGAAEAMGVADQVDVHVGTLSKAFGCLGGFAATTASMKLLLLNKGRTFVYSTALPLPVVAAAQAALNVSNRESWRRAHLRNLTARLGELLHVPALSPIIPLVLGPEEAALQAGNMLLQQGMHVPAIRPPTVPQGTSRLRVSLSAAHSMHQVEALAAAVNQCGFELQRLSFQQLQTGAGMERQGNGPIMGGGREKGCERMQNGNDSAYVHRSHL